MSLPAKCAPGTPALTKDAKSDGSGAGKEGAEPADHVTMCLGAGCYFKLSDTGEWSKSKPGCAVNEKQCRQLLKNRNAELRQRAMIFQGKILNGIHAVAVKEKPKKSSKKSPRKSASKEPSSILKNSRQFEHEGIIFSLGEPMYDVIAIVDELFLASLDMRPDENLQAGPRQQDLMQRLRRDYSPEFATGGSAQNSMRVAQWLLTVPRSTTLIGCVGKDTAGERTKSAMQSAGVRVSYAVTPLAPTGYCCVCVTGAARTLVASPGAASVPGLLLPHLEGPDSEELVARARLCYLTSYVLRNQPDAAMHLARHAARENRPLAFNLASAFVIAVIPSLVDELLPFVDILFGNESEALAYAIVRPRIPAVCRSAIFLQSAAAPSALESLALSLARAPKISGHRERIVVITRAAEPIIVVERGELTLYPVVSGMSGVAGASGISDVDASHVRDVSGAGDAFVGGFLACWAANYDPAGRETGRGGGGGGKEVDGLTAECVRMGIAASQYVIQRVGCALPDSTDAMSYGEQEEKRRCSLAQRKSSVAFSDRTMYSKR